MNGPERREAILKMLETAQAPISGRVLAQALGVSRQVIVQDMALLRAGEKDITATNSGYVLTRKDSVRRVFKVCHSDAQVEEELRLFVDYGATVEDVFIYHKIYGVVRAELKIQTEEDIRRFMEDLAAGRSGLLKNVTGEYHYHTVTAPSETLLNLLQEQLRQKGFLAALQDYEPVDFWKKENRKDGVPSEA